MRYVDGFVLPVPKKNLAAYRRMAQLAGKVWCEQANVRTKLGAATGTEFGDSSLAQNFERGQMFAGAEPSQVYILHNDGTWE